MRIHHKDPGSSPELYRREWMDLRIHHKDSGSSPDL